MSATDSDPAAVHVLRGSNRSSSGNIGKFYLAVVHTLIINSSVNPNIIISAAGLSASAESVKRPSVRRNSSKEKSRLQRSSSRRNKENGAKTPKHQQQQQQNASSDTIKVKAGARGASADQLQPAEKIIKNEVADHQQQPDTIGPHHCTEMDVQTFHVTLTYKPRI